MSDECSIPKLCIYKRRWIKEQANVVELREREETNKVQFCCNVIIQ